MYWCMYRLSLFGPLLLLIPCWEYELAISADSRQLQRLWTWQLRRNIHRDIGFDG